MSDARTYRVEHTTRYTYSDVVALSYGRAHLLPRGVAGQQVLGSTLVVDPAADERRDHVDFFGNTSTFYVVRSPHRELHVTARSEVRVERAVPDVDLLDALSWEDARDRAREQVEARALVLASPAVAWTAAVRAYAAESFTPGRGVGSATLELTARIHADFAYAAGATSVTSTLTDVMQRRRGVCQDFAHLAIGCLRAVGLPARYVSGYLETEPPPGAARLQGADASHAWASVLVPGAGWVDLDPTNDQLADSRYVVVAHGRDYADVPPLKGVIHTDAQHSTMDVAVDVVRVA